MKLSKTEEQLMQHLWKLEKAFMKDLIQEYDDPKPAATTLATLLKRMRDKGYIDYTVFGNSREYFPKVSKPDYFKGYFKGMLQNFFGNSPSTFASFFTKTANLTKDELRELRSIIDQEIQKKEDS